jgi:hypothetical protein
MASINSALAAFIKSTSTKELTLMDSYGKKETVTIATQFMETISDFFKHFSRYDIPLIVPVECSVAKRLLQFVQGQANDLEDEHISSYYKLASVWSINIVKDTCIEKIKKLKLDTVLDLYVKLKAQKDLDHELSSHVISGIMPHVSHLRKPEYIKFVDYNLLKELLTREDYEPAPVAGVFKIKMSLLEDNLCGLMLAWFMEHLPDSSQKENCDKFLECYGLLKKDCLLPASIYLFVLCPYYLYNKDIMTMLAPELLQELADINSHKQGGMQRDMIHKEKMKLTKVLTEGDAKKLQVGDIIEARDLESKWYMAKVVEKDDAGARVHFQGWADNNDEYIEFTSKRFAPIGTFTNGVQHTEKDPKTGLSNCGCNKCLNGKPSSVMSSYSGVGLQSLFDTLGFNNMKF